MNLTEAVELAERDRGLERDLMMEISRSKRTAWRIAGVSLLLACLAVVAVVFLTPLKAPPEMYVVRVDNATGEIEHVSRLGVAEASYGERMERFDLNRYVMNCESYDWYTVQAKFDACQLMSAKGGPQEEHARKYSDRDPHSIINRLGQASYIEVEVHSITLAHNFSQDQNAARTATVRFTRTEKSVSSASIVRTEHLIATIGYYYADLAMSEKSARINPLSFQVLRYQVDADLSRK
ncbi:MAG: virB8 family protein [Burkholderiaceae bacterium]